MPESSTRPKPRTAWGIEEEGSPVGARRWRLALVRGRIMKDVPDNPTPPPTSLTNERIARALEEAADLLESKDENPFRVRAFRRAAQTVLEARESIAELTLT